MSTSGSTSFDSLSTGALHLYMKTFMLLPFFAFGTLLKAAARENAGLKNKESFKRSVVGVVLISVDGEDEYFAFIALRR